MNTMKLIGVLLALALVACGSREASSEGGVPKKLTLPATVEGVLEISGTGEVNYGTLTAGKDDYLVEIDQKTLSGSGVAITGSTKVRATLGSESQYGDGYVITSLTRAD